MHITVPKPFYYYSAGITIVGGAYLLRDYIIRSEYETEENVKDKVIIVTGSNTGIGKEIVRNLATRQAKVIMACRDMVKCEEARIEIVLQTQNKYIYCRKCDLASQESIRNFVNQFKEEHSKLHVLINNAGVMRCKKSYTKEGIEMQLGVNHMGHFLLTNLLLGVLKNTAPARIVNVSSAAHAGGKIKLEDLNSAEKYDPAKAYSQSKLANVLFTRELANRLKGTGVTVNAVHPGIVNTEIVRHMGFSQNYFSRLFARVFLWLFVKSPKQGAQPVLYAALDSSLNDVTGAYISNCRIVDPSKEAKNDEVAKWLWAVSEKWTKLSII
ncbi:retinol dehydrogenase 13 [Megalopta genalis]|uniref:retinol dehydrogenase 13 n=1 Tax=Megalopta genalis TaxID=115081 RepID=UPI003FD4B4A6